MSAFVVGLAVYVVVLYLCKLLNTYYGSRDEDLEPDVEFPRKQSMFDSADPPINSQYLVRLINEQLASKEIETGSYNSYTPALIEAPCTPSLAAPSPTPSISEAGGSLPVVEGNLRRKLSHTLHACLTSKFKPQKQRGCVAG